MAELLVVRHGQASFGAKNYDILSDLGERQAVALGDSLRALGWYPDRVITGTLERQKQTLCHMNFDVRPEQHAGWNEYDFHDLLHSRFGGKAPETVITDRKTHFRALRETLFQWQLDEIPDATETWKVFCDRIEAARCHAVEQPVDRVLVVSSGGAIARLVSACLQVPNEQMVALNLQIKNSSVSRFIFSRDKFFLHEFNSLPHVYDQEHTALTSYS